MFSQAGAAAWSQSWVPGDNPRGDGSLGGTFHLWAGASPVEGTSPSPLPEASGYSQDVSVPIHPKICSFGALGAMLLSCCRARVWPPDGDLHPQCSPPSLGRLSRNASCFPHPAPALPAELWFLHPSTGLPRGGHPRSDVEPQTRWMGTSGRIHVSWGAAASAPAPRGWGLQQCLTHQTSQTANYILQRSQNYWDSFTCKLGSGGCSVAVLWEAEFGVIFR